MEYQGPPNIDTCKVIHIGNRNSDHDYTARDGELFDVQREKDPGLITGDVGLEKKNAKGECGEHGKANVTASFMLKGFQNEPSPSAVKNNSSFRVASCGMHGSQFRFR